MIMVAAEKPPAAPPKAAMLSVDVVAPAVGSAVAVKATVQITKRVLRALFNLYICVSF
jgi:hypothetical protein